MGVVFTATVGRSGSDHLTRIINHFAIDCLAEHEPPPLLLARMDHLPFLKRTRLFASQGRLAQIGRSFQRKYFFTDEMMGRGLSYEWLEQGAHDNLRNIAKAKVRRIEKILKRRKTYVEVSQYFIKTQAEFVHELFPDFGLIKLTRNPLEAARSLANRDKSLSVGGPPPHWTQNILRLEDWTDLSRFQLFALRWLETEIRFETFVRTHRIKSVFRLPTEDLDDSRRIAELFDFFGIQHTDISLLQPSNENRVRTQVSNRDLEEFKALLERLDPEKISMIDALRDYPEVGNMQ